MARRREARQATRSMFSSGGVRPVRATRGTAGLVGRGWARQSAVWLSKAGMARLVFARPGRDVHAGAWHGKAGLALFVMAASGSMRRGTASARQARCEAGHGRSRRGSARQAGLVVVRLCTALQFSGSARSGKAGSARYCPSRSVMLRRGPAVQRQGRLGAAELGLVRRSLLGRAVVSHGKARHGRPGSARPGSPSLSRARSGKARQGRHGAAAFGRSSQGPARQRWGGHGWSMARQAWLVGARRRQGPFRHGRVRPVTARQAELGQARRVDARSVVASRRPAWLGKAGRVGRRKAMPSTACPGKGRRSGAVRGWFFLWRGKSMRCKAGTAQQSLVRSSAARSFSAQRGKAGMAFLGKASQGNASRSLSLSGKAMQARLGTASPGEVWLSVSRTGKARQAWKA